MYTTSDELAEIIQGDCRTWRIWIADTSSDEIFTGEIIYSADSQQQSTSKSDDIETGAVCSSSWTVKIIRTDKNLLKKRYRLYFYLFDNQHPYTLWRDIQGETAKELSAKTILEIMHTAEIIGGELIPMGEFTVVKINNTADSSEITFADRLYFSDMIYTGKISGDASDIEKECLALLELEGEDNSLCELFDNNGFQLADKDGKILLADTYDFYIKSLPEKCTVRQVLSWIASAHGQFGFVNRFGKYQRKWYRNTEYKFTEDVTDVPVFSASMQKISGLSCTVSDSLSYFSGDNRGKILEFENPLMNENMLDAVFRQLKNFQWNTAEFNLMLGDPRLDIGDVCEYADADYEKIIPISSVAFKFDGGLSAEIKSAGKSDNQLQL